MQRRMAEVQDALDKAECWRLRSEAAAMQVSRRCAAPRCASRRWGTPGSVQVMLRTSALVPEAILLNCM